MSASGIGIFNQPTFDGGNFNPLLQSNNQAALPGMDYGSLGNYGLPNTQSGGANTGGFDWSGTMGGISQGLGGLTSLAQIYGMFQNLGLQKKAFKFAQQGTKRNFNAQALAYNNQIDRQGDAETAYRQANPSGNYSTLSNYGKVDKWT